MAASKQFPHDQMVLKWSKQARWPFSWPNITKGNVQTTDIRAEAAGIRAQAAGIKVFTEDLPVRASRTIPLARAEGTSRTDGAAAVSQRTAD